MGGFFGAVCNRDVVQDVFFGTDYHSHLGTKSAGMAAWSKNIGLQRVIHSINNSPFRTKFDHVLSDMEGTAAIGGINDTNPQPLLIRNRMGTYAICVIGIVNNAQELLDRQFAYTHDHYEAMTGGKINVTELVASLISQRDNLVDGITFAQEQIVGTANILVLTDNGTIIAARDRLGRLPIALGKSENGYCVASESFAYLKLDFVDERELGPGEIVEISADGIKTLREPGKEMRICAFMWTYYGYPTACYEGINVETMRYRNGEILARNDKEQGFIQNLDSVAGVPDSGTPHAIGYANESHIPFARPFIKYTPTWPRSFMPSVQSERNKVAKMKLIPVHDLIEDKDLLFVDDSVVRGTQLRETVEFLYENGARSVHIRSACPPIMYGCKYLNFSRATSDMELITRSTIVELEGEEGLEHIEEYCDPTSERNHKMREVICEKLHLASLEFQTVDGICESIGLDPCKLCTYCWNGKE